MSGTRNMSNKGGSRKTGRSEEQRKRDIRRQFEQKQSGRKQEGLVKKVVLGCAVAVVAVGFAMGYLWYTSGQEVAGVSNFNPDALSENAVIMQHVFINDIDVGGLSADEALNKLNDSVVSTAGQKAITLKAEDKQTELMFNEPGEGFDFKAAVAEALSIGSGMSDNDREALEEQLAASPKKIDVKPTYVYDQRDFREDIEAFAADLAVAPVNAKLERVNGTFVTTPEVMGKTADVDATLKKVNELVQANEAGTVEVVMVETEPDYTVASFEGATQLIGSYQTTFSGTLDNPRNVNIQNAAGKINDVVVYPDEVFSTNAAFGEMSTNNGYRMASVIVGGKLEDGIGGGVCQVSSTLYNALLRAELEIVERQNHSLKVGYVGYGYDATLAGDYIDLKFRNGTDSPVFIEAYLSGSQVVVNIYGKEIHDAGRTLEFSNALIATIDPPEEEVIEDPTLPLDERLVEAEPKTGYKYEVYKTVYENGQKVSTTTVNSSTYKAVRGVVRVGLGTEVPEDPNALPEDAMQPDLNGPDGVADADSGPEPDPVEVIPSDTAPDDTPSDVVLPEFDTSGVVMP